MPEKYYEYWEEIDTDDYIEDFLDVKESMTDIVHNTSTGWMHENAKLIDASIEDVEILSIEEADNVDGP